MESFRKLIKHIFDCYCTHCLKMLSLFIYYKIIKTTTDSQYGHFMSITKVISTDKRKKAKQKQLYYFTIFCCKWDALHVSQKNHNKKWPHSSKVHVLNLFTVSTFPFNTLRFIYFFNLSLQKSLGRVALICILFSRSIRNHLSLIWTWMSILGTSGYLHGKNFLFFTF